MRLKNTRVPQGSRHSIRLDVQANCLVLIWLVSAGTLWRHHLTLNMDVQRGVWSSGGGTMRPIVTKRHGTTSAMNKNLLPLLRENNTRTTNYTCRLLNETVTLPTIPHFLIVGAQKAGTTAFLEFLKQHPDLQSSWEKEPHFFDWHYPSPQKRKEWLTERGLPSNLPPEDLMCAIRKAYVDYFNTTSIGRSTVVFEKTPGYLFLNEVPERIANTLFWKPKIVAILRNPVDRAISNYRMKIKTLGRSIEQIVDEEIESLIELGLSRAPRRNETSAFDNNVDDDDRFEIPHHPPDVSEDLHWKHYRRLHYCNYIQRGMYAQHLERWIRHFPIDKSDPSRSSLLVLKYEEFREHPEQVFARLLKFVGAKPFIPPDGFSTMHNYHPERKEEMLPETRQYLARIFRPYNRLLVNLLGDEWQGVWEENGIP